MAPGGYMPVRKPAFYEGTASRMDCQPEPRIEEVVDDTVSDETLKKEINNLLWMFAPAKMPLGKAEEMACKVFEMFKEAQEKFK